MLGNAARSGLTINQGIDMVAREVPVPAGTEFKRINNEIKLGVSVETALKSIQKETNQESFNYLLPLF